MYRLATLLTGFLLFASTALAQSGGASPPMAGDTTATFEGLGTLGGAWYQSYATEVSGDGSVVVGTSRGLHPQQNCEMSYRWENGTMEALSGLPQECSFYLDAVSRAEGVSTDGSVIGGQVETDGGHEAYRWENGEVVILGDLPGPDTSAVANAVSSDGKVLVGRGWADVPEPFHWSVISDTMVSLGFLPGGGFLGSFAEGVAANGTVVVGQSDSEDSDFWEAYRWENGVMEGLGVLPGGDGIIFSQATDVSPDGSVVVGTSSTENGVREAFRWTAESDSMIGLGDLPGGDVKSHAFGVSADGSTIVGQGHTGFTEDGWDIYEAFIWTEEDGIRNLKEVLENDYGLDLTDWTLTEATSVSDDGLVIVGNGTNPLAEESEAWRVVLPSPVTPPAANVSPGSLAFTVIADGSDSDTLTIGNLGGSDLDWAIAEADNQPGACESPNEVAWVSATPNAGTTAPDASGEVVVTVDASGIEPAEYAALLCMTTNDPEADTLEVSVTMTVQGVADEATPEELAEGLSVPQPNPVNRVSTFSVAAKRGQQVAVEVFDATGRRVQTLYDGTLAAGMSETLTLDATALPAGLYIIRATGEDFVKARRVMVVR